MLMKVLLNFFSPLSLDGKRGGNRVSLGKKIFSEAALLILMLYNSSEDALLLFSLHPLIVSSGFRLFAAKLGIGFFGKDNPGTTADNLGIVTNNLGIATDDPGIATNNSGTTADNLGIETDTNNPGIAINNLGTAEDNPSIGMDANAKADDPGIAVDNPGIEMDKDVEVDNPGIVASNKARVRATSLFVLRCALFLLVFSSELVTASLPSSLSSSSSTTLQSKLILLYSVTLVKQRALFFRYLIDEI